MFASNSYEHKTYAWGCEEGVEAERERVLSLWKAEMNCSCEQPMQHLAARIKGDNSD
jgi:hypothetical protein